MKWLAFETSSACCSVAIVDTQTQKPPVIREQIQAMQQGRLLLPLIEACLKEAACDLSDIDAIAYGKGPGSFTGVRISMSAAMALSYALKRPVVAISSLQVLAQQAFDCHHLRESLVVLDARSQEVYWAIYRINAAGVAELVGTEQQTRQEAICPPESDTWRAVGDSWLNQAPPALLVRAPLLLTPHALALTRLAQAKWEAGEVTDAKSLEESVSSLRFGSKSG